VEDVLKSKCIFRSPHTHVLIFEKDEAFIEPLTQWARQERVHGAHISALGAFSDVTLAYFSPDDREYHDIPVHEQVEVVSLLGDIALTGTEPMVHAHAVVARSDGTTLGGHVREAHVWPTLELIVTETPTHLQRTYDAETGLALINVSVSV
jgi:predicted DNA-binding protein with PD1-like motif